SAKYDEDRDMIKAEWDYDDDDDVTYEVSLSTDGGDMKVLSNSEDKSIEIEQIESGAEYEIQVVAIKDDSRSDPKSTKGSLEDKEENQEDQEDMKSVENLTAE